MKFKYINKVTIGGNIYFQIRKRVKGKQKTLGNAKTLIQALMMRDWCMENNWEKYPKQFKNPSPCIQKTPYGKYKIVKSINGEKNYFGTFNTLEDAVSEKELLGKYNWDLEKVCECSDEGDSFLDGVKPLKSTFTKYDERRDIVSGKMWNSAKHDKLYCGGLD